MVRSFSFFFFFSPEKSLYLSFISERALLVKVFLVGDFSFSTLNILSHFLLTCKASAEKLNGSLAFPVLPEPSPGPAGSHSPTYL